MSEGIFHDMMTIEEFLSEWHNDSPSVLVHTSGSVVQRRSAGSWMLGMKYLYGRVKFDSRPELNYTATTGMALSIDRSCFVVKVHYDNFRFNTGLQDENLNKLGDEYAMQKNRMKGRFFNWGVRADFQMKF